MKRANGIWIVGTLLAATASASNGKAAVENLNRQYGKFLVAKDFAAIERFYDSAIDRDFIWQKKSGPIIRFSDLWEGNRTDMANKAKGVSDGPAIFKVAFSSWRLEGDKTVVDVISSGKGQWFTEGKWIPVTFRMLVRQTWEQKNGKWVATSFRDISVQGVLGKPRKTRIYS